MISCRWQLVQVVWRQCEIEIVNECSQEQTFTVDSIDSLQPYFTLLKMTMSPEEM